MKKVRINQIYVGDVIFFYGRYWFVESVATDSEVCGTRYFVKTHDCDDIFHIKYFTDNSRFYKVMTD